MAAGVVLFSLATEEDRDVFGVLDFEVLRLSFVALALVFAAYVWQKERDLRRAERALLDAQIRAAGLASRLRELSSLSQAGRALAASLSLDDVLQAVLQSARELLDASEGSLMLLDEETGELRVAAAVGLPEEARGAVVPVGRGVAGRVAETRKALILRGRVAEEIFPGLVPKGRRIASGLSVPLVSGDRLVGVLNVSVTRDDREYAEHDLDAAGLFAEQAAVAIANARLYERERQAREHLADLDARRREFVATLTHDLKAPLTSILGYTRLLHRSGYRFSEEESRGFVEVINRQGERMLGMVERLVEAARLEEEQPVLSRELLDLRALIDGEVKMLRGLLGRRHVEVRVPDDLPPLYGDPPAVQHMIANLLDNAVKYAPDGGRIWVEVSAGEGEVLVSVADEGPGIPEDMLPEVFERFRRAREPAGPGSVGLGLFIVQSLAKAHGGRAWAENVPGSGARVTFSLPYRRGER